MIRNGSTKIGEERRTRLLRPLLCLATSTLFLSGTPLLHGAKIKRAPRKSAPIYGSTKRAKPAPPPTPFNPTLGTPPVKITGITLIVPDTEAEYPMFRITRPDGNSADSPFGHWSPLTPVAIEEVPLAPTVPSKTPPTPTISLSAAPEFRQTVPLFPGSYQVRFSYPVPANPLEEMSGTLHWLEPVRLRKEQLAELKVTIPAIPKEAISHVRLKKAGPMAPFTSLTMEPVSGTDRSGVMTSRWDYFSVEQLWPDEVKVNLLPGSYRMILSAPAGPGYSSLKYEVPEPATLGSGTVEVPIQRPTFHTLKAGLTDRKGTPLRGTPLLLYGSGQTTVVLDSGPGNIEVRIPEGRYTVRALIFDDKGSREVTLERNLDLSKDQERAWKAPTTAIDFGFPQPAPSGSPTGSATILP